MKFTGTCLALALCLTKSVGGFSINAPRSSRASPNTSIQMQKYNQVGDDSSLVDTTAACRYCTDSDYFLSPRAARIDLPIKTLLAASGAFVRPALAAEETSEAPPQAASSAAPKEEATTESIVTQETLPLEPSTFEAALTKYFPKALPTSEVAAQVQATLNERRFTKTNTLFGDCVCPDEVNNKPTKSLPAALQQAVTEFGGVFHLGGLAGLPYMGVNGMRSFLSHTPSNGKVFVLYGPHVGITDNGVVGSVERLGRSETSPDCDTTMNANRLANAKRNKQDVPVANKADRREEFIVAKLQAALDTKEAANVSEQGMPAFVTFKMFDLVKEQLMKQLKTCLNDNSVAGNVAWDGSINEIVLLGGIVVNRGQRSGSIEPREDYFEPLVFEAYVNPGSIGADTKDLYQSAFGSKPIPFYTL